MGCEIDRFTEIIEKEKEHLKYLEQLAKTHKVSAVLASLFVPVLDKILPRQAKQAANTLLGLPTPFEIIQGVTQLVAVVKPEVMVTVIERALEQVQSVIEKKQKEVKKLGAKLEDLVEKLNGSWGFLLDFSATQSVSFNELYNKRMPEYWAILEALKTKLLEFEFAFHIGEPKEEHMEELKELFRELKEVMVHPGIDPFQEFLFEWSDISGMLSDLLSFDIGELKLGLELKINNFVNFTGSFGVVIQEVSRMLIEIQNSQDEAVETWEKVHSAFFKRITDWKILHEPLFQAIERFLETSERQDIDFGGIVSKETMEKWFTETKTSHQLEWYNKAANLVNSFNTMRVQEMKVNVEFVCEAIMELLLNGFSPDEWLKLESNVFFIEKGVHQMIRGLPVTIELEDSIEAVQSALKHVSDTLNDMVTKFKESNPAQQLSEIFGTLKDDRKIIKAITFAADRCGFDFFSKMVHEGNLLVALGLKESTSKLVQQLIACWHQAEKDGPAKHQKVALEIQNIINAELVRQKKLDKVFADAVEKDVQAQITRIDKYEHMLAEYGGA